MTFSSVLIGGATGATGSIAAKLLLEKGFPVRAFVHKDDERAERLRALGAEIFVGDLLDFRAVRRAFEGSKRAYFVYPIRPGLVQATAHYAQAALEAKAEFIVNLSQMTARPDALSDSALQHWLAERVFDWANTPGNASSADSLQRVAPLCAQGHSRRPVPCSLRPHGQVRHDFGRGPGGGDRRDPGQLRAACRTDLPPVWAGRADAAGDRRDHQPDSASPCATSTSPARKAPGNPFLIQHASAVAEMHALGQTAGTNDVVERITGHKPQTVAEFVEKHRAAFQ